MSCQQVPTTPAFNLYPRSVQVGEFEVAIDGGIWVAIRELNQRLKASFDSNDISLSDMKIEPIGRDGNAVYFSMRMNMSVGETSRPISGISGITLLNSLPLSVNVYEGTGSPQSRGRLQAVQQELLNSLLTEN